MTTNFMYGILVDLSFRIINSNLQTMLSYCDLELAQILSHLIFRHTWSNYKININFTYYGERKLHLIIYVNFISIWKKITNYSPKEISLFDFNLLMRGQLWINSIFARICAFYVLLSQLVKGIKTHIANNINTSISLYITWSVSWL